MGVTLSTLLFYPVDRILDNLQGYVGGRKQGERFLEGNWGPVTDEIFAEKLEVEGKIPEGLSGEFVRNGPNPKYVPKGGYHWFDGDGMLHGVRIFPDGTVNYVNHFVRTNRYEIESAANRAIFPRIGEWQGKLGLLKVLTWVLKSKIFRGVAEDTGTSNTAVVFHDRKLLALVESNLPMALKIVAEDGKFEELGLQYYSSEKTHFPFTAHPKIDTTTGEMLFFGYSLRQKPFCNYGIISKDGKLTHSLDIGIKRPIMMHDFAITENYSIFMDLPLEFRPDQMTKGPVFIFNSEQPSRIGVVPRYCQDNSKILWFNFASGFIFHNAGAYEQGDEVILIGCRIEHLDLYNIGGTKCYPVLYKYTMNVKTLESKEEPLVSNHPVECEFPTIHPNLQGKPFTYTYAATFLLDSDMPFFNGCVKVNVQTKEIIKRVYWGEKRYAGECVFVPKTGGIDEDDGYLLTFVFDENTQKSEFVVLDAKTMDDQPLARVVLPQRVPYGFHGIYVTESEIKSQ